MASDGLDMVALSFRYDDLELGEDFFMWPQPMNYGEALFVVDDEVERAAREVTS